MMRAKYYLFMVLSLSAMGALATEHPVDIIDTEGGGSYIVEGGVGWYFSPPPATVLIVIKIVKNALTP